MNLTVRQYEVLLVSTQTLPDRINHKHYQRQEMSIHRLPK